MSIGIHLKAMAKKNPTVAALRPAHKQNNIVGGRKFAQMPYPIGYLTTDCIIEMEPASRVTSTIYLVDYLTETFNRFGCLAI